MDKFDSLRNSIRQILEQEEKRKKVVSLKEFDSRGYTDEERAKLDRYSQSMIDDALSQQKTKNDSMTQDSAMDDVKVKDTASVVDEKVIDDILYRNKYKIGYVEYNGLMHLLCVLKVYGQNNPLPQDLKDFISLVRDYTLGLFDRQQQDLSASHNIINKNRLVEADSLSVRHLASHIKIIIKNFYTNSDDKVQELRDDNVPNSIKKANNAISSGLGFFTEILFYTYLSNSDIWENKLENFKALQNVFNLRLDKLKTIETGTYNASVDFAVMYFLLCDAKVKNKQAYNNILNEYIDQGQWNSRQIDVDTLAEEWSYAFSDPLDHCIEILKKLKKNLVIQNGKQVKLKKKQIHPTHNMTCGL